MTSPKNPNSMPTPIPAGEDADSATELAGRGEPSATSRAPGSVSTVRSFRALRREVSAIVVSYWTGPVLFDCIESLLAHAGLREILVINNGNPASVVADLMRLADNEARLHVMESGGNKGFAAGCNIGAARATGDYLAFVNPDCIVPAGTLDRILDVFEARENAWVCGSRLTNPDGSEQRGGRREMLSPWRALSELLRLDRLFPNHPYFRRLHLYEEETVTGILEVPTVSGAFMVIPKPVYERVGGMDDNMFIHFDDADFCIRTRQHGGKVIYCGDAPVVHHLSTSDVSTTFIEWHKARSTSYYFYKHFNVTYPYWFLMMVSVMLWVRFVVLAPRLLAGDLPGMVRRLGRR